MSGIYNGLMEITLSTLDNEDYNTLLEVISKGFDPDNFDHEWLYEHTLDGDYEQLMMLCEYVSLNHGLVSK